MDSGARFSISEALAAGLRLPLRQPKAVAVWTAIIVVVNAAIMALIFPLLATMPVNETEPSAIEESLGASLALQAAINSLSLFQLAATLIIWTAAMRATLKIGQTDRRFFLRFGMDELRVTVMMVAIVIGAYLAIIPLMLIGIGVGLVVNAAGTGALVAFVFIFMLLALAGYLVLWSRLSLLPAASLILGEFAFVAGWRMGRGQTARLVLLNLAIIALYYVAYIVVGVIVAAILIGGFFASGCVWPEDPQTFGDIITAIRPMTLWIVLAFVPMIAFAGLSIAFMAGAFASAARQLADGAPTRDATVASR